MPWVGSRLQQGRVGSGESRRFTHLREGYDHREWPVAASAFLLPFFVLPSLLWGLHISPRAYGLHEVGTDLTIMDCMASDLSGEVQGRLASSLVGLISDCCPAVEELVRCIGM